MLGLKIQIIPYKQTPPYAYHLLLLYNTVPEGSILWECIIVMHTSTTTRFEYRFSVVLLCIV